MVHSLLWVMQDFYHQPYGPFKGGFYGNLPKKTTFLQGFPTNSISGHIIRTYEKVGFGSLRGSLRQKLARLRFRGSGFTVLWIWGLGFEGSGLRA